MRFLRTPEVLRITGLSRTTLWRLQQSGQFPRPRRLSLNIVAWSEQEISDWLGSRPVVEEVANGR